MIAEKRGYTEQNRTELHKEDSPYGEQKKLLESVLTEAMNAMPLNQWLAHLQKNVFSEIPVTQKYNELVTACGKAQEPVTRERLVKWLLKLKLEKENPWPSATSAQKAREQAEKKKLRTS